MTTPSSQVSDQELVVRALADRHAFAALVERYQAPLVRYMSRLGCSNPSDIDDLLQDVFIKCYINMNEYNPDFKFSSWLYRIAHNETINFFRKKNIRPAPVISEEDLVLFENLTDESDLFETIASAAEASELRSALLSVQVKYREVLILRFFEEKSYTEISDILHMPEGTVATFIQRGKRQLKEILSRKPPLTKPNI